MDVPINQARDQFDALIARAEHGEEITLTRDGRSIAQLRPAPVPPPKKRVLTPEERDVILDDIIRRARETKLPGPDAAHAADFLYDENGLPIDSHR